MFLCSFDLLLSETRENTLEEAILILMLKLSQPNLVTNLSKKGCSEAHISLLTEVQRTRTKKDIRK